MLFNETVISGISVKNRIIRSATHDGLADENGAPTDKLIAKYENLAKNEIGCIITGYAAVSRNGVSPYPRMMKIYDDGMNTMRSKLMPMDAVFKYKEPCASFPAILNKIALPAANFINPLIRVTAFELNTPQRSDFRPIEAFFSSPYESMPSEKKHSAESKLRPFRCVAVLKEQIFVTARRKSARNTRIFQGFSTKLWRKYAFQNRMEFECSHSKQPSPLENFNAENAAIIKNSVSVPVIVVGGIHKVVDMKNIIAEEKADFVSMCRPFICEPDLTKKMKNGQSEAKCIMCNYCGLIIEKEPTKCLYGKVKK